MCSTKEVKSDVSEMTLGAGGMLFTKKVELEVLKKASRSRWIRKGIWTGSAQK